MSVFNLDEQRYRSYQGQIVSSFEQVRPTVVSSETANSMTRRKIVIVQNPLGLDGGHTSIPPTMEFY